MGKGKWKKREKHELEKIKKNEKKLTCGGCWASPFPNVVFHIPSQPHDFFSLFSLCSARIPKPPAHSSVPSIFIYYAGWNLNTMLA
jgi:hypothetical protein